MVRTTNYNYTNGGLLQSYSMGSDVVNIIRPEDDALPYEGEEAQVISEANTKIISNGATIQMEMGVNGLIKKLIDPNGKVVTTEYNKNQQPIRIASSDGQEISMSYDELGNLIKKRDEKSNIFETFTYEDGNLVRYKDGEGRLTGWDYNGGLMMKKYALHYQINNKQEEIETKETLEEKSYNSFGQPVTIGNNSGELTELKYDDRGNIAEIIKEDQSASFEYDLAGNVLKNESGALLKTFQYDNFNRPLEVTDNDAKTIYKYDELKRLIEILQPNGLASYFSYDIHDRLMEKRDVQGNSWRYEYNELGKLITTSKPDGNSIEYEYDEAGNPVKITSGVHVIVQEFDESNQLVHCTNEIAEISRVFNLHGLLTEERYILNNEHETKVQYKYDASSLCTQVRCGNNITEYQYDQNGQPNEIKSGAFLLDFYPSGKDTPEKFENEYLKIHRTYQGGRLQTLLTENKTAQTFALSYEYDEVGNCTKKEIAGVESWSMQYNDRQELSKAQVQDSLDGLVYKKQYTYDTVGNRIKQNNKALIYDEYFYQLKEDGDFHYEYDPNGNLTKKISKQDQTEHRYEYDVFDQLIAFRKVASSGELLQEAYYGYDGLGRRIKKEIINPHKPESDFTRWYIYDKKNVLAELDEAYQISRHYIGLRALDQILGFVENETAYYFIRGKFNTIEAILDFEGKKIASYSYSPFGELLQEKSEIANDYLYIGREYDRELEAYYLRARHYDPRTGRFFQVDPDAGKLQDPRTVLLKYAYGNNNPFRYFDPEGKSFLGDLWDAIVTIADAVFTYVASGLMLLGGLVGAIVGFVVGGIVGALWGEGFWQGAKMGAQIGWAVGVAVTSIALAIAFPPLAVPILVTGAYLAYRGYIVVGKFVDKLEGYTNEFGESVDSFLAEYGDNYTFGFGSG